MKALIVIVVMVLVVIALSGYLTDKTAPSDPREENRKQELSSGATQSQNQEVPTSVQSDGMGGELTPSVDVQPIRDVEAVVSLGKQAESHSRNLGHVRQELGDLVQQAVDTKKELLNARFKASAGS